MKLYTHEMVLNAVPERWKQQFYGKYNTGWMQMALGDSGEIYKQLIDARPLTDEKVSQIIGKGQSWSDIRCDHCGNSVNAAVNIDVTAGEYSTFICLECLQKAISLFGQAQPAAASKPGGA